MPTIAPSTTTGSGRSKPQGDTAISALISCALLRPRGTRRAAGLYRWRRPECSLLARSCAFEEHSPQQVIPLEQLLGGAVEADLALLHEVGVVHEVEGDVDALLDEHDRGALGVDAAHHVEELGHDHRRQPEG